MSFGKTSRKELFTYYKIQLKKTATKKLLGITIDEHLNFNKHITNICQSLSRKFITMSRVSSLLSLQQKNVVSNSFISVQLNYCPLIWTFVFVRCYSKINKLHDRCLRLCNYDKLLSKQDLVNIRKRNIQQLMIEIFKCLKGISPLSGMRYLC